MLLKQLIRDLPVKAVRGPLEREVLGIAYDIRRVVPGMLYVAIPGEAVSGNESIPVAVDRGAIAVVCESEGIVPRRATRIDVASARAALSRAAAAYYGHPAGRLWMVGVAGGCGAAEVGCFLKQLLDACGMPAGRVGALEDEVAGRVFRKQRGEFEALDFQHRLAGMVRGGCRACVVELAGAPGELAGDGGVDFDAGVCVDLAGADALEVRGAEGLMAGPGVPAGRRGLRVVVESGRCVEGGAAWTARVREMRGASAGTEFTVSAREVEFGAKSSRFVLAWAGGEARVEVGLVGAINVRACLAAIATAFGLGLAGRSVCAALSGLHAAPGRLELVGGGRPVGVYVDGARTAEDLAGALSDLRALVSGRILAVFGSRQGESREERLALGRAAAMGANFAVLTGDNPGRESAAAIAEELSVGFGGWRRDGWRVVLDRREAIGWAMRMALAGDAVLVAGKGHDTVQQVADTVMPFDDRVYACEWMERLGWSTGRAC